MKKKTRQSGKSSLVASLAGPFSSMKGGATLWNARLATALATSASLLFLGLSLACAQTRSNETQSRPRRVAPANAKSVMVKANGDLQAAINAAQYGDSIILQAGATYESPYSGSPRDFGFSLPNKGPGTGTDADYITIRTSDLGGLPGEGVRVSPANAGSMAKIVANTAPTAVSLAEYAHHYRFIGIAFTNKANTGVHTHSLVGGPTYNPLGSHPYKVEFDRCLFYPIEEITDSNGTRRSVSRGVYINGAEITLKNSYCYGFTGRYKYGSDDIIDSECLMTDVGPGPFHIINNFLEAWYNNIFTGGAGPGTSNTAAVRSATLSSATLSQSANLNVGDFITFTQPSPPNANAKVLSKSGNSITFTPLNRYGSAAVAPAGNAAWNGETIRNVEIRQNTFHKRPEWATAGIGNPKGFMEIKTAKGLIVDGNIFQGARSTIALTSRNQDGSTPWTTIEDVQITNNRMDEYGTAIILLLADNYHLNKPGGNVTVANNLFKSSGDPVNGTRLFYLSGGSNVKFLNNTAFGNSNSMVISDGVTAGVELRDNIFTTGEYVMSCTIDGKPETCWPSIVVTRNVFVDSRSDKSYPLSSQYPQHNQIIGNTLAIGFVDYARGNYRLSDKSPYKGRGTNGKDPGVDFNALEGALSGSHTSLGLVTNGSKRGD